MSTTGVRREERRRITTLSLDERVRIESRAWDAVARRRRSAGALRLDHPAPDTPIPPEYRASFPDPRPFWVGRSSARFWEYQHLAPLAGKTVLQLGGSGRHAVRFLLAGAARAVCVDPSEETLRLGADVAARYGVSGRLTFVRGIAERLPFPADTFDAVYGGSVLHHTLLGESGPEIHRVLKPGGRASFHDPLEGYALARLARTYLPYPGKGDEGVDYPLSYAAVRDFARRFRRSEWREFELFGVPVKLLLRLHRRLFDRVNQALHPLDDALVRRCPPLRRFCKGVSIRVEK